jgi:hypothetical protein
MHAPDVIVEQQGEPCPKDAVGSLCLLELEAPLFGFYTAGRDAPSALILTVGEQQLPLDYWGVRDFLGKIDTPNEAAVLAWSEGWQVSCAELSASDDGYTFEGHPECWNGERTVLVSTEGRVSANAFCPDL